MWSILCVDGKCERVAEMHYERILESKIFSFGVFKYVLYHLDAYDAVTDKIKKNFERVNTSFLSNI